MMKPASLRACDILEQSMMRVVADCPNSLYLITTSKLHRPLDSSFTFSRRLLL